MEHELCYKCGEENHKAKECSKAQVLCLPCLDIGAMEGERRHDPGSGKCGAFRKALEEAKGAKR